MTFPRTPDVLVLGAGIAGLAAARTLAEAGLQVTLVEARPRVGGRILTRRVHGHAIELGAEFVHGNPPDLLQLVREAGLTLRTRTGAHLTSDGTRLHPEADIDRDEAFAPLEHLKSFTGPDLSFTEYLDQQDIRGELRSTAISYVEGFNAADSTLASAAALGRQQQVEDSSGGAAGHHIVGGYDQLPEFLATRLRSLGATLLLDTPVTHIDWQPGRITLHTPAGPLQAPRAILTLPLGILQSGSVPMLPAPTPVLQAISSLCMGPVCRFTLIFRRPFWQHVEPQPDMQHLSFLFSPPSPLAPSVWWTTHPEPTPTLTGWVGGPRAVPFLTHPPDTLARNACTSLAHLFQLPPAVVWEQLLSCEIHDWTADPCSRGAYSYVRTGGLAPSHQLATPVQNTLFFAGEHTDLSGNWGTVHGALGSGLRAASQVLGR